MECFKNIVCIYIVSLNFRIIISLKQGFTLVDQHKSLAIDRGMKFPIILLLLLQYFCQCKGLLVLRSSGGDLFQNLGFGEDYCTQRNAECSTVNLDAPDKGCTSTAGGTCPSCVCAPSERYSDDAESCIPDGKI